MEVDGLMPGQAPRSRDQGPVTTRCGQPGEPHPPVNRTPQRSDDEAVLVLAEDFEDVNGMARQVGLAADLVDATFLAITGDLTFAGLPIETYIIDTVDHYSDGRPCTSRPACMTPRWSSRLRAPATGTSRRGKSPRWRA